MNPELVLAHWTLGKLTSAELPRIATAWMLDGRDSPALRELAGLGAPIMSDAQPLWEAAVQQLGMAFPDRQSALRLLARTYAEQIAAGSLPPHTGAQYLAALSYELDPQLDLITFVAQASEMDDFVQNRPVDPPYYDRLIQLSGAIVITAAADLVRVFDG